MGWRRCAAGARGGGCVSKACRAAGAGTACRAAGTRSDRRQIMPKAENHE